MTHLWCEKREQRIALEVCLNKQCRHMKQKGNEYTCKKKPKDVKLLEKRALVENP